MKQWRFVASQIIWMMTLGFLLFNYNNIRFADKPFIIIGIAVSVALLINIAIWFREDIVRAFDDDIYENLSGESETDSIGKRKRKRIDTVLHDLSNDDLIRLKYRLEDGSIDDDVLYDRMVGEDGELIQRN